MKDIILRTSVTVTEAAAKVRNSVVEFSRKEDGVTAIEYAVIAVAISGILLTVFGSGSDSFVTAIKDKFTVLSTNIKGTVDTPKS